MDSKKLKRSLSDLDSKTFLTIAEIARSTGLSRNTVAKTLKEKHVGGYTFAGCKRVMYVVDDVADAFNACRVR